MIGPAAVGALAIAHQLLRYVHRTIGRTKIHVIHNPVGIGIHQIKTEPRPEVEPPVRNSERWVLVLVEDTCQGHESSETLLISRIRHEGKMICGGMKGRSERELCVIDVG